MRKKNYQINTCRRRYYTEIGYDARWSIQGSNDYTQKKTLQRKQKTIRSQNTKSEKDCRDLTKMEQKGQESWEGSATKVAEGSDASRKYVARVGL